MHRRLTTAERRRARMGGPIYQAQFRKEEKEPEPRPHNAKGPIDLRKHPVCYLCGHPWMLWDDPKPKYIGKDDGVRTWKTVIQCISCLFLTFAYADEAVMHSRGWRKHK
jgi:hypothetical protein